MDTETKPPSSPPQDRSFNWLACCGISCGVLLVLCLIVGVVIWSFVGGTIGSVQRYIEADEQIKQTDLATIKAQTTPVTSFLVAADPDAHTSGWLEMEGLIIPDPDGTNDSSEMKAMGTAYWLEGNVLVIDNSNTSRVGIAGDKIRCWGKTLVFDLTAIPLRGVLDVPDLDLSDVVLFMAKGVELAEPAGGLSLDPNQQPQ